MTTLSMLLHELFIARTPSGIVNQYANPFDLDVDKARGHIGRQHRFVSHLSCEPKVILLSSGYGPGSLAGKFSGIPYTTEEVIMQGKVPRLIRERFTVADPMHSDWKSSTIWNEMAYFGLERDFIHWAVQPFVSSTSHTPHISHRTISQEVNFGLQYIDSLLNIYQGVPIIAFGGVAEYALKQFNVSSSETFALRDRNNTSSMHESLLHFTNTPWREEIARIKRSNMFSGRDRRAKLLQLGWEPHPNSHSFRRVHDNRSNPDQ